MSDLRRRRHRSSLLLALNAFFVGAEFALISARRTQIEPRRRGRLPRWPGRTLRAMENVVAGDGRRPARHHRLLARPRCRRRAGGRPPDRAAARTPLGVPDDLLHPIAFAIALAIVVYLHVVLGEMVPKNIALAGPERAALVLGPPMMARRHRAQPGRSSRSTRSPTRTLRVVRVEPKDEVSSTFTREEVAALVEESRGEGLLGRRRVRPARRRPRASPRGPSRACCCPSTTWRPYGGGRPRPRSRRCARRPATPGSRSSADERRPRSATCTSRTCSRPTRTAASTPSTTSGSGRSRRCGVDGPAARRAGHAAGAAAPTWRGSSTPTGPCSGVATLEDVHRGAGRRDPRRGPRRRTDLTRR